MESQSESESEVDSPRYRYRRRPRYRSRRQPVSDRIDRAVSHDLRLLHRSDPNFFILGATGNVYTVTLSTTPSCTCPDPITPCKHILFVLIRVLGVSIEDRSLYQNNLRPCSLFRLLNTPSAVDSLADSSVRQRFHKLYFGEKKTCKEQVKIEEGTTCPICLDDIEVTAVAKAVACETCKNVVHEECLTKWRRTRGSRGVSCVICRARWSQGFDRDQEDAYLNLAT
ncbi:SWIM zinc finger family protein / mitogen-activated protein kinase kinase kinase (MAPKKK)-related [Euphorbia peplus]|nr:SWIM zinc finger family protein / mitogen-activated protein kinase kinase kinase (MAPKKK)-related [Euphorbia peplus]